MGRNVKCHRGRSGAQWGGELEAGTGRRRPTPTAGPGGAEPPRSSPADLRGTDGRTGGRTGPQGRGQCSCQAPCQPLPRLGPGPRSLRPPGRPLPPWGRRLVLGAGGRGGFRSSARSPGAGRGTPLRGPPRGGSSGAFPGWPEAPVPRPSRPVPTGGGGGGSGRGARGSAGTLPVRSRASAPGAGPGCGCRVGRAAPAPRANHSQATPGRPGGSRPPAPPYLPRAGPASRLAPPRPAGRPGPGSAAPRRASPRRASLLRAGPGRAGPRLASPRPAPGGRVPGCAAPAGPSARSPLRAPGLAGRAAGVAAPTCSEVHGAGAAGARLLSRRLAEWEQPRLRGALISPSARPTRRFFSLGFGFFFRCGTFCKLFFF